ncbi:hypothetical protein M5W83_12610 [Paenibacillus thiaminolyticus]|uniref:Uncharacterized protein n=1 Tax=Paenibacillus thiaminolyticus TaxID=49283 RepID=A0ABT4FVC9_PANTH|nr:hypothetical protein [Paenibacillus thiaminolyticus]MCY9537087.1 hypothetical protein [Paenibacillus thiaminolyticus]MCY9603154.1 hypothetical protein [Paenibacillus thiaminolyticus]MCY9607984.1 hypothetical protein [Paenibacillus thiaminolyticus]MCY9613601.1 hypothetical protein [Paenibacillus thiaminolyticus]MCY9618763.1 hypothetical protein [Paenibacillus thiaminolyticus]
MKKASANYLAFNPSSVLRMINPFLQRRQSLGAADDDICEAGETACDVDLPVPDESIRHPWKQ